MYQTRLVQRKRVSEETFEIRVRRPRDFAFQAGQHIRLTDEKWERDYSMVSAPDADHLDLYIRQIAGGKLSVLLAEAEMGTLLRFSGPHGYLVFRPSSRAAVFVATGTGIAPFLSMIRSGVSGFTLLHGVRHLTELYGASFARSRAGLYVPCVTRESSESVGEADIFPGRVTEYLGSRFPPGAYDFYVCGGPEMIRDITFLADERFPGSLVYSEQQ